MQHWFSFWHRPTIQPRPLYVARRWPLVVGVVVGIWFSYWLYSSSLSLPYLQEDVTHIRWLSWHTPFNIFLTADGAPDYRPLGKAIIKVWYLLLGHHDRAWLRYHNIALNALNVALTAVLATWIDCSRQRYYTGGLAAILFGTLPFAYQSIPWINNFFYPLINFLLLLATAVYWQARVRHSTRLLVLAFLIALIAPFEIEYGAMGFALLATAELTLWLQKRQRQMWLPGPVIGLLMNTAFVWRSLTIPKQEYSFGPPTPERLMQIATYFLQGITYPFSFLSNTLFGSGRVSDLAAIQLVSLPILLLVGWVLWRWKAPLLAMSLLWFTALNLPALVFLNFDYVINSPRLLYPPGVGIAWLWGGLLTVALTLRQKWVGWGLTAVFLTLTLSQSIRFVNERIALYHLSERSILDATEVAQQTPDDQRLLFVNTPSWLTPERRTFAVGNNGIQLIPFYIGMEDVIYGHTDADQPATAIQFANIRQPQPYYYGMLGEGVDYEGMKHYLLNSGPVYLTQYAPDHIQLVAAGRVTDVAALAPQATFGNQAIALALADSQQQGDQITLTLTWQILTAQPQDLTVFVHLYAPDGSLVTQADGYPLLGMAPFWLWDTKQTLQDQRILAWPADAPAGQYQIGVGIYDPAAGQRIPAQDSNGRSWPNDTALLLTMERP
ncbi:MAG: hypothetical protein KC423_01085 [Anaerolineales bacterium]|nr:hypothetical protein [Anaerolineales bacterium]